MDLTFVAAACGARGARAAGRVQSLWSGYGEIVRVALEGAEARTAIVKHVRPPARAGDVSHARKVRSYAVEAAFYASYAERCDASCRVPRCFAHAELPDGGRLLVLEDLDAIGLAGRTHHPDAAATLVCLRWLASFHARFVGVPPERLWSTGTYWHLATRREELAALRDRALEREAERLDRALAGARWKTIVHGDAKPANFCFGAQGVAAVDFQYTGGGVGIRDVAYLLDRRDRASEQRLLDLYFERLRAELAPDVDGAALEAEWRALYPVAIADYRRFLAGWCPG